MPHPDPIELFYELHGIILRVRCDVPTVTEDLACFFEHLGLAPHPARVSDITIELSAGDPGTPAAPDLWIPNPLAGYSSLMDGERIELRNERAHIRIHPEEGRAAGIVRADGGHLHMNLVSHTLLTLLRYHDLYPLHAAGLTKNGAGVLVVADSGGGKSTIAADLLHSGWDFISDDSLLLRPTPDGVEALALRRDLFVLPNQVSPTAGDDASPWENTGKIRLDIRNNFPDQVVESCRPELVVFPRISGKTESRLESCTNEEALHLLAHHALVAEMERGRAARQMDVLAALVGQCRFRHLNAGRDLVDEPGLVARLLEAAG